VLSVPSLRLSLWSVVYLCSSFFKGHPLGDIRRFPWEGLIGAPFPQIPPALATAPLPSPSFSASRRLRGRQLLVGVGMNRLPKSTLVEVSCMPSLLLSVNFHAKLFFAVFLFYLGFQYPLEWIGNVAAPFSVLSFGSIAPIWEWLAASAVISPCS